MRDPDKTVYTCPPSDNPFIRPRDRPTTYKRFIEPGDEIHINIEPYTGDGRLDFAYETLLRISREKIHEIDRILKDWTKEHNDEPVPAETTATIKKIKDSILLPDKIRRS